MPHFTESEIEEVKRMNRLEDVARASGCELKKHGTNKLVTLCPFHAEKSASCVIDRVRNTFKCFGCGKSGDVIAWKMETEGLSFTEAVQKLGGRGQGIGDGKQGTGDRGQGTGEQGQSASNSSKKSTIRTEQLFDPEMTGEEMLERTAQYYHEVGLKSPFTGRFQPVQEMIVFGFSISGFVIEPIVARQMLVTIGPQQGQEIDPAYDRVMLA